MKSEILQLDKTMEDLQQRNSARFDKLESDIEILSKLSKTLREDSRKLLNLMDKFNSSNSNNDKKKSFN